MGDDLVLRDLWVVDGDLAFTTVFVVSTDLIGEICCILISVSDQLSGFVSELEF